METPQPLYAAKLVWFAAGPAWTCQKYGKHVITIHRGDTPESRKLAEDTAAHLNEIDPAGAETKPMDHISN